MQRQATAQPPTIQPERTRTAHTVSRDGRAEMDTQPQTVAPERTGTAHAVSLSASSPLSPPYIVIYL